MVGGMNLRTPIVIAVAVLSALGGIAAAAIALPTASPRPLTAAATPTPQVRTETIRRTIHVVRPDEPAATTSRAGSNTPVRPAPSAPAAARVAIAPRHAGSGHDVDDDDGGAGEGADDHGG